MPNSLAAAICRMTACIDTLTAGIAILWPSLKSLSDLIAGSRTSSISGETLKPVAPFTSIGVPLVFDQMVTMPGMPRQTKSTLPEISASFITSLERNVAQSIETSPRPAALACFSIIFWSCMMKNCM
jgi:hypothetical protein